jgi:exosortase A-associated hydrolase 1
MSYREKAVMFDCNSKRLVGIVSLPSIKEVTKNHGMSTGVVIVVGGPQYRAGSHRQFVLLARELAGAGFPVLRFDYRGMGDSTGELRDFLDITPDIAAGVSALLAQVPGMEKIVLWGLCDGASAALMYIEATQDTRIAGLCLLNPWVRSEASLARTHVKHYYTRRLLQKAFWQKLLTGGIGRQALSGLCGNIGKALNRNSKPEHSTSSYPDRMASAWHDFKGKILLQTSENDLTAKEFLEFTSSSFAWNGAFSRDGLTRHLLHGADHTLSDHASLAMANRSVREWLFKLTQKDQR